MEDEEGGEEEVEDIVGREHGQDLSRLYAASYQCLICQIVVHALKGKAAVSAHQKALDAPKALDVRQNWCKQKSD